MERRQENINHIDFLKCIGLICVIIAHVQAPDIVMNIRCFDVVLLVFISAYLSGISFDRNELTLKNTGAFLLKRFKRIVFPVWIFLAAYFLCRSLSGHTYTLSYYLYSFCLTRHGIGYVWIMLIYLMSALWIPVLRRLGKVKAGAVLALLYVLYEILVNAGFAGNCFFMTDVVYYLIPYGAVSYLGYNYRDFSRNGKFLILAAASVLWLGLMVCYRQDTGFFVKMTEYKYPPRAYWLSFGIMCTFGLMMICERFSPEMFSNRIIRFYSKNSMWIYLWHIMGIDIATKTGAGNWVVKLVIVLLFATIMTCFQKFTVTRLNKWKPLGIYRYLT